MKPSKKQGSGASRPSRGKKKVAAITDQILDSSPNNSTEIIHQEWSKLREYTAARIALGRTGGSQKTSDLLRFQLDHARARDAIHGSMDSPGLAKELQRLGLDAIPVRSAARDRSEYLKRPDLGRSLCEESQKAMESMKKQNKTTRDSGALIFVIADGLSPLAVQKHAAPFLEAFLSMPTVAALGPLFLAEQARVALGDPIAEILGASLVAVLIGERPGLSSPDSMGLYMTYQATTGTTDERRNCISNIRQEGLPPAEAAKRFHYLATRSLKQRMSGFLLKDESTVQISAQDE
ncbi:MAG: ethanolamine ammonia-lyase subunit EutC [Leptospiraceae bacterium]|nr:ethanolamine ammonia-lyase subunit EutC [Leptospiraceae bacterium]